MVPFRHFAPATAFSLIALALSPGPAAAQTPAVGFTTAAYGVEDNAADTGVASYSLGFEFTANGSNFVTSLGYFNDPSFNPSTPFNTVALSPTPGGTYTYSQSHDVALYQITGLNGGQRTVVQLAAATITSAGTRTGDFLYTDINPVLLVDGGDYVLAGVTGSTDPYLYDVQDPNQPNSVGLTTNGIHYVQDRYDVSSTLTFPGSTDAGSEPAFFGPNLKLSSPSAAPEPSEWAVMGLIALGLGVLGLRARRAQGEPQAAATAE